MLKSHRSAGTLLSQRLSLCVRAEQIVARFYYPMDFEDNSRYLLVYVYTYIFFKIFIVYEQH